MIKQLGLVAVTVLASDPLAKLQRLETRWLQVLGMLEDSPPVTAVSPFVGGLSEGVDFTKRLVQSSDEEWSSETGLMNVLREHVQQESLVGIPTSWARTLKSSRLNIDSLMLTWMDTDNWKNRLLPRKMDYDRAIELVDKHIEEAVRYMHDPIV